MKCLIVYNPFSGKQKFEKYKDYVIDVLKQKYETIDVYSSQAPKSIISKVTTIGEFYDFIMVCGGDGTLNEVVNGLMNLPKEKRPKIGYVPCGTVNDVGHLLKLKNNYKKAVELFLNEDAQEVDLCKALDRYFIYATALGKFTDVSYATSKKLKKVFGKLAYYLQSVISFFKNEKIELEATLDDGRVIKGKYYVVLGLNSSRVAGYFLYRKVKNKINDGRIDLTLVKQKIFPLNFINLALFFIFGDRWKHGVDTYQTSKIHFKTNDLVSYNIDGEFAWKAKDMTVEVIPSAIKIIVSKEVKEKHFI